MASAWASAVVQMKHAQFGCGDTVNLKLRLLQTILVPTVHYGCEVWGMHSTHVAVASAARADLQRLYEFYLHRVCGLPRYVPSLCLLCELGLQPLKVYWLRHTLRFWDKLALAPLGSFHKTMMLDNLQDAVRFKVPNFCRSLMATLKHLGHAIPSGYNVLPTIDVDSVVSTEELSLRLPPPVFLDPRSAPSLGVVQCTYSNWFWPGDTKFRCCHFPTAASRMQKLLAFKLGAAGLPVTEGRRSGVSRADRHCPLCDGQGLGDELHAVFECAAMQPLRVKYAHLFAAGNTDMRTFFAQPDTGGILDFV